jgi:hypothetical protein
MRFPPSSVSPRRPLTDSFKLEAEPYAIKSAARGLCDKGLIDLTTLKTVYDDFKRLKQLSYSATKQFEELLRGKQIGLYGEMAFNIYRKLDYRIAFEVVDSYIHKDDTARYPFRFPDACLDSSCHVKDQCKGSIAINVKTRFRAEDNEDLGLKIDHNYDKLYVAVSERCEHNASYNADGKRTYKVIDYAILGYASSKEVSEAPHNIFNNFIHYYKLHPIDCLTPSDYETSETVYDRMKKLGYV